MAAEKPPVSEDKEMRNQGYISIEVAANQAKNQLQREIDTTKMWLDAYYHGSRFFHGEAYPLCAVGQTWPDFMQYPHNDQYIVSFEKLNSADEIPLREDFQNYVVQNRQLIVLRAAEKLGIDLNEINNS